MTQEKENYYRKALAIAAPIMVHQDWLACKDAKYHLENSCKPLNIL